MRNEPTVDRLALMETFVRIVEAGSLTAAAAQMQTTQPTISRRLGALERALGVRLLQRSTHRMRLTVDGERCYARAKELIADWSAFEDDLRGARQEPEGTLRVAVPHAFGQDKLVAPLADFLQRHPRVAVEWLLQDDVGDFIANGIDCAIQVGEPSDPGLVAIKLAEVPRIVVAAPALLGGRRAPREPSQLAALPWIALRTYYRNELLLRHERSGRIERIAMQPRMSTDSLYALRSAAVRGIGVGVGSTWLLMPEVKHKRLVELVPGWRAAPLPMYIVYPRARHDPSRLTRFLALMREAVPAAVQG
jgi:DNA-binding transcriptional LysR family regulator